MLIGGKELGAGQLVLVAEAGSTHRGDVHLALRSVDAAKQAGANSIKFIASNPATLIADRSLTYDGQPLYETIDSYRFKDNNDWRTLASYCHEVGIDFFVSAGTPDYIPLMVEVGVSRLKLGGWDSRNFPLISAVCETGLPLQVDLGAVIVGEVDSLLDYVYHRQPDADVTLLYESHGDVNLRSIPYLKERYGLPVGYSSDGQDSTSDILAVALGADIIEKRLKPDTDDAGHHRAKSLAPDDFKRWVEEMRRAESMLGRRGLYPSMADVSQKSLYFTSLVYDRDAKVGTTITRDMLASRRPGTGLSPYYDYLWLGKPLKRDVKRNQVVSFEDV